MNTKFKDLEKFLRKIAPERQEIKSKIVILSEATLAPARSPAFSWRGASAGEHLLVYGETLRPSGLRVT